MSISIAICTALCVYQMIAIGRYDFRPFGGEVLNVFLTQEDLIKLTGKRKNTAQIKVLRFMGIEHRIRPDGSVAVLEAHVKAEMGMSHDPPKANDEWTPKWSRHA